jgi:hypothetical protein
MYRRHPGGMQLCIAAILAASSYVSPPSWRQAAMYRRQPGGMQLCTAAILAAKCSYVSPPSWRQNAAMYRQWRHFRLKNPPNKRLEKRGITIAYAGMNRPSQKERFFLSAPSVFLQV